MLMYPVHIITNILYRLMLLVEEDTNTKIWTATLTLRMLERKYIALPLLLITNQERAQINTLTVMFATEKHIFCKQHMQKYMQYSPQKNFERPIESEELRLCMPTPNCS